jgi:hypothetical protein
LAEPDIHPFVHKLSTNNHKNNSEIVPRILEHNPSKNFKNRHTSRLPIQISLRFDSLSSASGGSIYVSNTPINSMKKNPTAAISFAN